MARKLSDYLERPKRTKKNIILIGAEGKNKTENRYFINFNHRNGFYNIKIASGNSTDPVRMVRDIIHTMEKMEIMVEYGDKVYCVLDMDIDKGKNKQILDAMNLAREKEIEIITSTPCFEDWYLCHFNYTTKCFTNSSMIQELKKYIPNYQKNMDVYPIIRELTKVGIENAKKQCKYQEELGRDIHTVEANPCTEIYKIVEELMK